MALKESSGMLGFIGSLSRCKGRLYFIGVMTKFLTNFLSPFHINSFKGSIASLSSIDRTPLVAILLRCILWIGVFSRGAVRISISRYNLWIYVFTQSCILIDICTPKNNCEFQTSKNTVWAKYANGR